MLLAAVLLAAAATATATAAREDELAAENARLKLEVARLSLQIATPSAGGWVAPKVTDLKASKPNILIIFGDDIGYADLGAFGHPTANTPHLDHFVRLAAAAHSIAQQHAAGPCHENSFRSLSLTPSSLPQAATGSKLTQYYSAANICSPSRGSLMTGRLYGRLGIYSGELYIMSSKAFNYFTPVSGSTYDICIPRSRYLPWRAFPALRLRFGVPSFSLR